MRKSSDGVRENAVGAFLPPGRAARLRGLWGLDGLEEGRVEAGGGEKPSQTNPSEACLIVTEFPAGVTLKNHPQEES